MFLLTNKIDWKKIALHFIVFIIIVFALRLFIFTLTPFFLGIVIAFIIDRPVSLMSRKIPRGIAVMIMILVVIIVFLLLAFFLITNSVYELSFLIKYLPQYHDQIMDFLEELLLKLQDFFERIPNTVSNVLQQNLNNLYKRGENILSNMIEKILNMTFNIPNVFLILLFTIISAFFLSKDKEKILAYFHKIMDNTDRKSTSVFKDLFTYTKVQLIIMTNTSILTGLVFYFLKYPYIIILALIAGILDLIPVVGPGAILWPIIIFNILFNLKHAIIIFILYIIIISTRPILESRVLGKRIGVHPLILLLGVYIGLKTLGFQGVILAPISIIMFKAVYDAGLEDIYFSCLKQKKE